MCKKRNFYIDKLQETNHTRTQTHTHRRGGGEREREQNDISKKRISVFN